MFRHFPKIRRCRISLCILFMMASVVLPASASKVKVFSSDEMDFPQGLQSVLVELRASGYEVEVETSDALEPGRLLEVLETSSSEEVVANVSVVKMGRSGIAYVWLRENGQMYRVTSTGTDPAHAANILSLRVSELISLRGEGFAVERAAKKDAPEEPAAPGTQEEAPQTRSERHFRVLALLGPQFDAGMTRPFSSLQLALGYTVNPGFVVELMGHSSIGTAARQFDQGQVSLEERGVAMSLAFQTGRQVRWQLGPTFGAGCFLIHSEPVDGASTSKTACRTTLGALARLGRSWDAFSLWLSGQLGYGMRRVDLVGSGQVLTSLARPDGSLRLGAGWHF